MPFDKRFWISFAAVLFVSMALGFVVHGLILAADYEALPNVMRTAEEQEAKFGFMFVAHLFLAFGFSWLYRGGKEPDKPWLAQGVRFGVALALAVSIPIYLIYHTVAQFPLDLAIKQCALESLSTVLLGITLAFINR